MVQLIDPDGNNLGQMKFYDAWKKTLEYGLDLVEISPNAKPPVCKILDYGRYKYDQQKNDKKKKICDMKEIQLRPTIDKHDLEIKLNHAKKFIEGGHKVKFILRFKGRENSHREVGLSVFDKVQDVFNGYKSDFQSQGNSIILYVNPVMVKKKEEI